MKFNPRPPLSRLLRVVRQCAETPTYLVGGILRDALLGRETTDLDLAVEGSAEKLARRLARELKGALVVLDDATRVYRVALPQDSPHSPWVQLDIAQVQGKDIQEDILRRDFTINAMAWPIHPEGRNLLDPRGGLQDLRQKLLRAERPAVFREDPLRLLRAFRIASQLGFSVEPATLRRIRSYRGLVTKPAGERISHELLGIMSSAESRTWLELMDRAGILTILFPELEKCRRCAQVYYGRGGVLRHLMDTADRMDFLLKHLEEILPDIARDVKDYMKDLVGSWDRAMPLLRLAAILHDIAKPATARKIKGRLRFFGHDALGAKLASKHLRKLRFSNDEISLISGCILHHLRPGNLAANAVISDKAAYRFFQDVGSNGVALLLVCWADHASYLTPGALRRVLPYVSQDPHDFALERIRGADIRKTLHHLQAVAYLLRSWFKRREKILPPKLLDGHAVMKALKIQPGPAVGRAMKLLQEAQADGKVGDRAEALAFLNKIRSIKDRS